MQRQKQPKSMGLKPPKNEEYKRESVEQAIQNRVGVFYKPQDEQGTTQQEMPALPTWLQAELSRVGSILQVF
jgi:P pilus assembly chaperone PapD